MLPNLFTNYLTMFTSQWVFKKKRKMIQKTVISGLIQSFTFEQYEIEYKLLIKSCITLNSHKVAILKSIYSLRKEKFSEKWHSCIIFKNIELHYTFNTSMWMKFADTSAKYAISITCEICFRFQINKRCKIRSKPKQELLT